MTLLETMEEAKMTILMTLNGKKVKINPPTDICLYESPVNPPNTGTSYTRGADLFAHRARSGTIYFYLYHWSMWQGEEGSYQLITEENAKKFLLEVAQESGYAKITEEEWEKILEVFPSLDEEDA